MEDMENTNNNINKKIVKISDSYKSDLKVSCSKMKYFSICLDESNDKTDVKNLVFFYKSSFLKFDFFENFLKLVQ